MVTAFMGSDDMYAVKTRRGTCEVTVDYRLNMRGQNRMLFIMNIKYRAAPKTATAELSTNRIKGFQRD